MGWEGMRDLELGREVRFAVGGAVWVESESKPHTQSRRVGRPNRKEGG
jgi:hypothetical protein